jgi:hypothetical protein
MSNDWNCVWATTGRLLGIDAKEVERLSSVRQPVGPPGGFALDLVNAFDRLNANSEISITLGYKANPSRKDIKNRQNRPGLATGVTGPFNNGRRHAVVMETRRSDNGQVKYYDVARQTLAALTC